MKMLFLAAKEFTIKEAEEKTSKLIYEHWNKIEDLA